MAGLTLSGAGHLSRVAAANGFRNAVRAPVYRRVDGRSDVNEFGTTAPPSAAMQLTGLHKRFGEKVAVEGLTLTVPTGSFYGLVGPNGAGKSTLANIVSGYVRADGGRVRIGGRDVTTMPVHRRSRLGIGRTFQNLELFDGPIFLKC